MSGFFIHLRHINALSIASLRILLVFKGTRKAHIRLVYRHGITLLTRQLSVEAALATTATKEVFFPRTCGMMMRTEGAWAAAAVVFIILMLLKFALQVDTGTALVDLLLLERQIGLIVIVMAVECCVLHLLTLIDKLKRRLLICCLNFGNTARLRRPKNILQIALLIRLLDFILCLLLALLILSTIAFAAIWHLVAVARVNEAS